MVCRMYAELKRDSDTKSRGYSWNKSFPSSTHVSQMLCYSVTQVWGMAIVTALQGVSSGELPSATRKPLLSQTSSQLRCLSLWDWWRPFGECTALQLPLCPVLPLCSLLVLIPWVLPDTPVPKSPSSSLFGGNPLYHNSHLHKLEKRQKKRAQKM